MFISNQATKKTNKINLVGTSLSIYKMPAYFEVQGMLNKIKCTKNYESTNLIQTILDKISLVSISTGLKHAKISNVAVNIQNMYVKR